ncbi:MAG: ferrous iron transport protein B [Reinekea forsetii]|nr:ferrous iron transport protein B [Reinekea forsetii]
MTQPNTLRVALIGNPNCGKTTLFNSLTGAHQKVGNWPGVTIERKTGAFSLVTGERVELVDLPGIYSLEQDDFGLDEQIAANCLLQGDIDIIINLVDASCLDRQLLLSHQLRDYDVPILVVANMLDVAEANQQTVRLDALSQVLGLPVLGIVAAKSSAASLVRAQLTQARPFVGATIALPKSGGARIAARLQQTSGWVKQVVVQGDGGRSLTERVDRVVLNRFLGIPIFLLSIYLLFTFAINVGAIFIDFFDILLGTWLVEGTRQLLTMLQAPAWLSVVLADGLGSGIQLVGTFIPVIGFLYLGLSVLEGSGYIVRAAFVVDRLMQSIGLPGRAFVPLIVGFGCNVPSVMATRTLDRQADRMVTIAMTPFMSCGARLTVYALFAAAFFGHQGQNVVFGLYLFGIAMAVLTGWIFRRAFFQGAISSSIMEMPVYHIPSLRNVLMTTWHRLQSFLLRAGKTIIQVVVLLSFLNSWGTDGSFGHENSQASILSAISRAATPLLAPIGVQADNWPATVGVITGIFAKEAVVGTLDSLYADVAGVADRPAGALHFGAETLRAVRSISDNGAGLIHALSDPLGIQVVQYDTVDLAAADQAVRATTLTTMAVLFVTPFAAFCYLLFILLYTPCVAVMGALVREAGSRWAWVVISWSTVLAYGVATIVYQLGTVLEHPLSSSAWVVGMLVLIGLYLLLIKRMGRPLPSIAPSNRIPLRLIG